MVMQQVLQKHVQYNTNGMNPNYHSIAHAQYSFKFKHKIKHGDPCPSTLHTTTSKHRKGKPNRFGMPQNIKTKSNWSSRSQVHQEE